MAHGIQRPDPVERQDRFSALQLQLKALLEEPQDAVAAMANMCAALHEAFGWHWSGFYRVLGSELILGPFQGPVACTRIPFGKGVCGTAWKEQRTMVVPDVELFPGHIACSPFSRSEIVVPVYGVDGHIHAVLDIDSTALNDFSEEDGHHLEDLCRLLEPLF